MYWVFFTLALLIMIPASVGLYRWQVLPQTLRLITILLWLGVIQTILKAWWAVNYGNNLGLSHIYACLELTLVGGAYYAARHLSKNIYFIFVIPLALLMIVYGHFISPDAFSYNRWNMVVGNLAIIGIVGSYLITIKGKVLDNGLYWISGGLLISCATGLINLMYMEMVIENDLSLSWVMTVTNELVNFIVITIFTIALWRHTSTKYSSVSS